MNEDQVKGKIDKAKGYVKEKTGEITNDRDLEAEGAAERASGKLREGYGDVKEKAGDAAKDALDDE
jgi:uncharacterized protein YjbJ (UPF0337 family)